MWDSPRTSTVCTAKPYPFGGQLNCVPAACRNRRDMEHSKGLSGWDVSFSLMQFVGNDAAFAAPVFKHCEQAALDVFTSFWS